jgi:hypothetical protein
MHAGQKQSKDKTHHANTVGWRGEVGARALLGKYFNSYKNFSLPI